MSSKIKCLHCYPVPFRQENRHTNAKNSDNPSSESLLCLAVIQALDAIRHPYVFHEDLICSVFSSFAEQEMVISSVKKEFLEMN